MNHPLGWEFIVNFWIVVLCTWGIIGLVLRGKGD
jgi:hypothetical protein